MASSTSCTTLLFFILCLCIWQRETTAFQPISGTIRSLQSSRNLHYYGPNSSFKDKNDPTLFRINRNTAASQSAHVLFADMQDMEASGSETSTKEEEENSEGQFVQQAIKKKDLVQSIAMELDLPKAHVLRVVNAVFDQISAALISGHKVNLSGFGSFETRYRQPRMGRNPQSGEILHLPGAHGPAFSFSKTLKDAIKSNLRQLDEAEEGI